MVLHPDFVCADRWIDERAGWAWCIRAWNQAGRGFRGASVGLRQISFTLPNCRQRGVPPFPPIACDETIVRDSKHAMVRKDHCNYTFRMHKCHLEPHASEHLTFWQLANRPVGFIWLFTWRVAPRGGGGGAFCNVGGLVLDCLCSAKAQSNPVV